MGSVLRIVGVGLALVLGETMGFGQLPAHDQLFEAVSSSDLAAVKRLLKQGVDPNATYANAWPMISRAIDVSDKKNGIAILKALIEAGANVNAVQPDQGWTPLHSAVAGIGPTEVVELLIQHGANLEAQKPGAGTPLHLAASSGSVEYAKVLLRHGANIDAISAPEAPPRSHETFLKGIPKEMRDQMAKEFELDARKVEEHNRKVMEDIGGEPGYDRTGQTPLMRAAGCSPSVLEMVRFLLDHGAKVGAVDSVGRTALHEAALVGSADVVELLIKHGAKVDARSKNGLSPLHLAVRPTPFGYTSLQAVALLIEHGANVNALTKSGISPLRMCEQASSALLKRIRDELEGQPPEAERYIDMQRKQAASIAALLKKHGAKLDGGGKAPAGWIYGAAGAVAVAGIAWVAIRRREVGRRRVS